MIKFIKHYWLTARAEMLRQEAAMADGLADSQREKARRLYEQASLIERRQMIERLDSMQGVR